jgi:hypothetical protein
VDLVGDFADTAFGFEFRGEFVEPGEDIVSGLGCREG